MAVVHQKANKNVTKCWGLYLLLALCICVPVGLLLGWFFLKQNLFLYAAIFVGILALLLFRGIRIELKMLQSGIRGEQQVVRSLKRLPKQYHVIANPVYHVQGRTGEMDAVVIGPNGVCIVETKSHSGKMTGAEHAEFWTQQKRDTTKQMKNPLRQVTRQQELITTILKEKRFPCSVRAFVYFSNKNAQVQVQSKQICTDEQTLLKAMQQGAAKLSKAQVETIVRYLK